MLTITDVHPLLDGSYEMPESFTGNELHAIKIRTGLRGGELTEALSVGDYDMVLGLALVCLIRAGKIPGKTPWSSEQADALWDADIGAIVVDFDEEVESLDPPSLPSENGLNGNALEPNGSSGNGSTVPSEPLVSDPDPIGHRLSGIGST